MGQPAGFHHWDHISVVGPEFVGPFLRIDEIVFWFSRVILRGVADPANEVLLGLIVVIEDLFNFVFLIVFYDLRRG